MANRILKESMSRTRKVILFPLALALILPLTALAQTTPPSGPKIEPGAMGSDYQPLLWRGSDAQFVLDTMHSSRCAIQAGDLVTAKLRNPDVESLASEIGATRAEIMKKLRSMAKGNGFRFEDKKHLSPCTEADRLSELSGEDLAKAYLAYLAKENSADVARFQSETNAPGNSSNFDLRKFTFKEISTLEEQQSSIVELRGKLAGPAK